MGYSNDISHQDFQLLRRLAREIEEFFKVSHLFKEVRASDIYDFIKNRPLLKGEFPTGKDFSRFLRRMHLCGFLLKVIPNINVDDTNYHRFRWWFYRRERTSSDEVLAKSEKGTSGYFKNQRSNIANNNDNVRSQQERYIYNRLLNEADFSVSYERRTIANGEWKSTDFFIEKENGESYTWEHAGMAANDNYALSTTETIPWYIENGYIFIENGGNFIVTYYRDEHEFREDVERIINLIKTS